MFLGARARRTRTVFTYLKAHLREFIATKTVAACVTSNCKSLQWLPVVVASSAVVSEKEQLQEPLHRRLRMNATCWRVI
jgi:hypothetical protein